MSEPEVYVSEVRVDQDRICIPNFGEDPNDCTKHKHVPGRRELRVDVRAVEGVDEAAMQALVGKRVRLVAE